VSSSRIAASSTHQRPALHAAKRLGETRIAVACCNVARYGAGNPADRRRIRSQADERLCDRRINQDLVTDLLWPDSEGDAADQALRTTVHRLRKLLQHERALRLEDRLLHLDPRYVWADCLAFDRTAHHPQLADRDSLQRAFDRYRGPFLDGDSASRAAESASACERNTCAWPSAWER
jgi:hypothetical protein